MNIRFFASGLLALSAGLSCWAEAEPLIESSVRVQLMPPASAVLSAEISAKVQRLPLREGDAFGQGDLLLVFDASLQAAQLERAESLLRAAEATAAASNQLLALKSAGQLEVDLSTAELHKARAEVRYAQEMLSRCTVKAPYAGRVAERKIQEHEFAQVGQPLLEIIAEGALRIEFIAPSRHLSRWKPGNALAFAIDETGTIYPARIERIGARIEPVSQTVKVIATIEGTYPELVPGMTGTLVKVE